MVTDSDDDVRELSAGFFLEALQHKDAAVGLRKLGAFLL